MSSIRRATGQRSPRAAKLLTNKAGEASVCLLAIVGEASAPRIQSSRVQHSLSKAPVPAMGAEQPPEGRCEACSQIQKRSAGANEQAGRSMARLGTTEPARTTELHLSCKQELLRKPLPGQEAAPPKLLGQWFAQKTVKASPSAASRLPAPLTTSKLPGDCCLC